MTASRDATDDAVNQCDGCRRGLPLRSSRVAPSSAGLLHFDPDLGYVVMACTADRYVKRYGENDVAA